MSCWSSNFLKGEKRNGKKSLLRVRGLADCFPIVVQNMVSGKATCSIKSPETPGDARPSVSRPPLVSHLGLIIKI